MPVISSFFGIVIRMYYQDHGIGHFHAEYQGYQATFTLDGGLLAGQMPRTAQRLVKEWAIAHTVELEADWERARSGHPLEPIQPLE